MSRTTSYPIFSKKPTESVFIRLTDSGSILESLESADSTGSPDDPRVLLSRFVQWAELISERRFAVEGNYGSIYTLSRSSLTPFSVWPVDFSGLRRDSRYWVQHASGVGTAPSSAPLTTVDLVPSTGEPKDSSRLMLAASADGFDAAMEAYTGKTDSGGWVSLGSPAGHVPDGASFIAAVEAACGPAFAMMYVRRAGNGFTDGGYVAERNFVTTISRTQYQSTEGRRTWVEDDENGHWENEPGYPKTNTYAATSTTNSRYHAPETLNESNSNVNHDTVYDVDWEREEVDHVPAVTNLSDGVWTRYEIPGTGEPNPDGQGGWSVPPDVVYLATDEDAYDITTTDTYGYREHAAPSFSWKVTVQFPVPQNGPIPVGYSTVADIANDLFPVSEAWYVRVKTTSWDHYPETDQHGNLVIDSDGNEHWMDVPAVTWKALRLDMSGCSWTVDGSDTSRATITLHVSKGELLALIDRTTFQHSASTADGERDATSSGYDGEARLDYATTFVPYVPRQRLVSP